MRTALGPRDGIVAKSPIGTISFDTIPVTVPADGMVKVGDVIVVDPAGDTVVLAPDAADDPAIEFAGIADASVEATDGGTEVRVRCVVRLAEIVDRVVAYPTDPTLAARVRGGMRAAFVVPRS